MEQINDLQIDLEESIDLSDWINLDLRVSKLWKRVVKDLETWKKNLNLRPKPVIKIEKNKTKNFDTIYFSKSEEKIDLFSEKKEDFLKKKVAVMKFKLKNIEMPRFQKNKINIKKEDFIEKKEEIEYQKEEAFVEKFAEKNSKDGFQVFPLYKFRKKVNYFKILFFVALFLFVWLLDKIIVETLVKTSYTNLTLIKNDFSNIEKVRSTVSSSGSRLFFAKVLFAPFSIIPNKTVRNVNHLITWWRNLTELLNKSLDLYENIDKWIKTEWWPANIEVTSLLKNLKKNYDEINNLLVKAYLEYYEIKDLWDNSLNEKLSWVKQKLNFALITLDKINKNFDTMLSILWEERPKKYLVVFQNNDEIRATGWFIWSMALIDLDRWKITKVDKKDVYALEWQLNQVYKDKEKAPEWLNKITWTFWLRDANYFPEIKDSAAKIKFFLDKIDLKIDWIVFINQNMILDLLDSIEWIYSKTLWAQITKENFSMIVSTLVEAEVFKEWTLWTPKQALFLFAEELYERLNWEKKYYDYLKIILNHIENRDIVFYSFDPVENSLLWKLWLNWEINFRETLDFNYPIYSSIWWNKSDRYMDYRYEKTVKKAEWTCKYSTNLKIFNTHTFSPQNEIIVEQILDKYEKLWKKREDIINIQWKGDNKSYLRILLPKEAKVSLWEWQKVTEYEKYKILEFYTETKAWQTTSYDVNYSLETCKNYSYKFFKQPWIKNYQILFDILWKQSEYNDIKTDFIYKD